MEKLQILLSKLEDGSATDLEKKELLEELSLNEEALRQLLSADFEKNVRDRISALSPEESHEIFRLIQANKEAAVSTEERVEKKITRFTMPALKWLAAASVAGIIFFAGRFLDTAVNGNGNHDHRTAYQPATQKIDTIANIGNGTMVRTLDDGTIVWLEANSAITYSAPFGVTNREIGLNGKATFLVAKETTKPFTVLAGGLATTALGTRFSVNAYSKEIQVKLFEGKVVVKLTGPSSTARGTYLLPGDELNIDMRTHEYVKTRFDLPGNSKPGSPAAEGRARKPGKIPAVALKFNKTPLNEVFDQISKHYEVTIKYRLQDVHGLPFTGSLLPGDSISSLLRILCNTNDLKLQEKGKAFIIIK